MSEAKDQLQHDAEHEPIKKGAPIARYLVVLFSAALVLLVMAYLMQQRSSEAAISDLTKSLTAMRSVDTLTQENEELRDELEGLQLQIAQLEAVIAEQETRIAEQQDTIRTLTVAPPASDTLPSPDD